MKKWLAGGRAAAVVSGCFCLSSNRCEGSMGGMGWLLDPDGGILALTSEEEPFITMDIDLTAAEEAKHTYPRYVAG